ncbi:MAG: HAMP domain-containing histidine kinase [Colwellia sp.]|nr:HAMP domain-containing histidine kinase [Colwellia sp.]
MALAQHFDATQPFNSASVTFNNVDFNDESLLARETFPGELAALRNELAQLKPQLKPKFKPQLASQLTSQLTQSHHKSPASLGAPLSSFLSAPIEPATVLKQTQMADQLIEMMPTGLVMLDGNGIVVKINKVARSLLEEPILGQLWFNVIARSFKPRADDWHEVSLKDGRRVKLEIASLGDQPGQLIMITDLTETRLLQDKVGQMQRLSSLGKMISTLAHQIRTPLSAAMLYSANLSNRKLADSARATFQEKLSARLHDLEQQVNDMLLFSKSGNEQVVAPLCVNELINDSVQTMDALITKAKAQVNVQLTNDHCQILANKNALIGAIQNLIHNALQAASAAKSEPIVINIQVYVEQNTVYISVQDNGPGIDLAVTDKIFEPFYTSSSKGTGLGLAVVKSVVEAHQGEVSYLSQAGQGAHFCLKLPLLAKNKLGEVK